MANKIEIIDNFLTAEEFGSLRDIVMSADFAWFYNRNTAKEGEEEKNFYFTHTFYDDFITNSTMYPIVFPLITKLDARSLIRAKANLYPRNAEVIQDRMHKDYSFPHKGAIFYLNTNNGPTVFEDGASVDSVANRLLKFEGSDLHCSSRCSDEKVRVNINFNYF